MKLVDKENKFIVVEMDMKEHFKINFGGICDMCSMPLIKTCNVICVLAYGVCPECYSEWKKRAIYYDEDSEFERGYFKYLKEISKAHDIRIEGE